MYLSGQFSTIGIFFYPNALKTVFGLDASELTDTCADLDMLSTARGIQLSERLLNSTSTEEQVEVLSSFLQAVKGQDAVFCALGAGRKGKIRSQGTSNIIKAMERAGVKQLICETTLGAGDSKENLNFFWKHIMFGMLLKAAFSDHQLQEQYIMESNLDWIIVRPGAFTNGAATGNYRHGFSPNDRTIRLKISRADVADFMLKQLTDATYLHKTPGLSY